MAQDIANELGLCAKFHLSAGMRMAQDMSPKICCSYSGTLSMGVQDVANSD